MSNRMRPLMSWRKAISVSDLEPTTRHVALTLSLHMNESGGSCFPSQKTLAAETGLARSTVNSHLGKLLDAGFLMIGHRRRESDGRQSSNEYQAAIPEHLFELMEVESRGGTKTVWLKPRVLETDTDLRGSKTLTCASGGHQEDAIEDAIEDDPRESPLTETEPAPVFPPGDDDGNSGNDLSLFPDGRDGVPTRAEKHRDSRKQVETLAFEHWWLTYPRGKRGSKATALKFWLRMGERQNVTAAEMMDRLRIYRDGRDIARRKFGADAPLMHASTFIGGRDAGRHLDYIEPFTEDDERLEVWRFACERQAAQAQAEEGKTLYQEVLERRNRKLGVDS